MFYVVDTFKRFGSVLDVLLISNIQKELDNNLKEICQTLLIDEIFKIKDISEQKYKSKTFDIEKFPQYNWKLSEGDIIISLTLIFPDYENAEKFENEIRETYNK